MDPNETHVPDESRALVPFGSFRFSERSLLAESPFATVTIADADHHELSLLKDFVGLCNGRRSITVVAQTVGVPTDWEPVRALISAGILLFCDEAWKVLGDLENKPGLVPRRLFDAMDAYLMSPWPSGWSSPERPVWRDAAIDRSALARLPSVHNDQLRHIDVRSTDASVSGLVQASMGLNPDTHRFPIPSAGDLRPTVIVTFTSGDEGQMRVAWSSLARLSHGTTHVVSGMLSSVSRAQLIDAIIPDGNLEVLLERGAGFIVFCADLRRVCAKYGARGRRFALLEIGAYMEHMTLVAARRGVSVRAVGGYRDDQIKELLGAGHLEPFLGMIVAFEAGQSQ